MKIYWKIAEKQPDGKIKTLFHGVNGTRVITWDKWLEAVEKPVNDGSGPTYLSGWHVLPSVEVAHSYLKRFTTRTDQLVVLPCHVRNIRRKEHADHEVYLTRYMKLLSEVKSKCGYCCGAGWKSDDSYSTFPCPWCDKGIVTTKYQ